MIKEVQRFVVRFPVADARAGSDSLVAVALDEADGTSILTAPLGDEWLTERYQVMRGLCTRAAMAADGQIVDRYRFNIRPEDYLSNWSFACNNPMSAELFAEKTNHFLAVEVTVGAAFRPHTQDDATLQDLQAKELGSERDCSTPVALIDLRGGGFQHALRLLEMARRATEGRSQLTIKLKIAPKGTPALKYGEWATPAKEPENAGAIDREQLALF